MAASDAHYDELLGPVYAWMVGDVEAALEENRALFRRLGITPGVTGHAVDLGAGPGLQSIPLAEAGFSVLAVDTCGRLLAELEQRAGDLSVRIVQEDLACFREIIDGPVDAIVCMGDTLPHLGSHDQVEALTAAIPDALAADGVLVLTFRDYATVELRGTDRFITVRSDADRILTCFLEYGPEKVRVHDILQTRRGAEWTLEVGVYEKLRLDPGWVADLLSNAGLSVERIDCGAGLTGILARRPMPE